MRSILIVVAGCLALGGCAPDTVNLINALSQDPNAVCVTVNSLYGSATYSRNHGCELNAIQVATPATK